MTVLHVAFKVAGAEYVLPASAVLHLESFTGATQVPGTPEFVAGLVIPGGRWCRSSTCARASGCRR